MGGKFHLQLNNSLRPIAHKYHEGKMKRTLKRELKVFEIAEREANGTSITWRDCCLLQLLLVRATQVSGPASNFAHAVVLAPCVSAGARAMLTTRAWQFVSG